MVTVFPFLLIYVWFRELFPAFHRIRVAYHVFLICSSIRYDACGTDLVATGSSDSTVKVFEGSSGMLKATFRGGSGNSILCCDISNGIIVGAGTDKTCRVWNLRTDRMVRI